VTTAEAAIADVDGRVGVLELQSGIKANPMQIAQLRWYDVNQAGHTFPGGLFAACAMAFDGTHIWVTDPLGGNVNKLRASDGAIIGTFATPGAAGHIAFDGANIWVNHGGENGVTKM
jgi:outer membrane protein assembly factor BamB